VASDTVGDYEIEYSGARLDDVDGWAAWVTIYGPSSNPMHRNSVIPTQRVALEEVFASEAEAETRAHEVALAMLAERAPKPA
jgi:hypothetical protein